MPRALSCTLATLLTTTAALAEVPSVVTDFGPTRGIVARVMDGVGAPTALLTGADTPHDFALRPSHARDLSNADLIVWVGHANTPWLEEPLENLGGDAVSLELLETEGWTLLANRDDHEDAHGDDHDDHDDHDDDHGDKHDHDDDHADHNDDDAHDHEEDHADHDDEHDHEEEHAHDDHDDDHKDDHGDEDHADAHDHHDHGPNDPHAWLDPDIAAVWAVTIADTLGEIDPANAETYAANATAFGAEMTALSADISATIADLAPGTVLLSHDNLQYFEVRFGFEPAGYIAATDAAEPGPAHLRDIRDQVAAGQITCIVSDIETNPGTLAMLLEGGEAGTAILDATDSAGAGYEGMMRSIAASLAGCAP